MLKSLLIASLLAVGGTCQRRPTRTWTTVSPPQTTTAQNPYGTQSLYGQCGGQTYTGPTRCPIGAYCKNDGNPWYEQCVAIETSTAAGGGSPVTVTTRTRTSTISVPGPTPITVTTFITYVTPVTTTPRTTVTVTLIPDEPYTPKWP